MTRSRWLALGVAAAIAVVAFLLLRSGTDGSEPVDAPALGEAGHEGHDHGHEEEAAVGEGPESPLEGPPPVSPVSPAGPDGGPSADPPPPPGPAEMTEADLVERPAEPGQVSPETAVVRHARAIELVTSTIDRLEGQIAEAEAGGDAERARLLTLRRERLIQRQAALEAAPEDEAGR